MWPTPSAFLALSYISASQLATKVPNFELSIVTSSDVLHKTLLLQLALPAVYCQYSVQSAGLLLFRLFSGPLEWACWNYAVTTIFPNHFFHTSISLRKQLIIHFWWAIFQIIILYHRLFDILPIKEVIIFYVIFTMNLPHMCQPHSSLTTDLPCLVEPFFIQTVYLPGLWKISL